MIIVFRLTQLSYFNVINIYKNYIDINRICYIISKDCIIIYVLNYISGAETGYFLFATRRRLLIILMGKNEVAAKSIKEETSVICITEIVHNNRIIIAREVQN